MTQVRLAATLVALGLAMPASAADFTFDVPVRVQNLPSMHTLVVDCTIYTAATGGTIMGRGTSGNFPITGGNYDGTVTVEITASGTRLPHDARAYSCSLSGVGTARTGSTYRSSPGNFQSVYETATGHSLARVVNTVRGSIP